MNNILDTIWETALDLYYNDLMEPEALEEFAKLCKSENCFTEANRIRDERDREFLTQFDKTDKGE